MDGSVTIKSEVVEANSDEIENYGIKFLSSPDNPLQAVKSSTDKISSSVNTSGKISVNAVPCKFESKISQELVHEESAPKVPILCYKSISSGDNSKTAFQNNSASSKEPRVLPKLFPCGACSKNFTQQEELLKHIQSHTKKIPIKKLEKKSQAVVKIFSCKTCKKRFSSPVDFRYHRCVKIDFLNVLVKCQYCFEDIKNSRLAIHMRKAHTDKDPYRCEQCGASLTSKTALKTHVRARHKNPLVCEVCKKQFRKPENLENHIIIHHTTENSMITPADPANLPPKRCVEKLILPCPPQRVPETLENLFMCRICSTSFALKETFQQHLQTHLADNFIYCKECDLRFQDDAEYRAHSKLHVKLFPCRVCGKTFKQPELQDHMKVHANLLAATKKRYEGVVKIYHCEYCEKTFGLETDFTKHQETVHKDIKRFSCEFCPSSFTRKYTLISHIKRRHLNERPKYLGSLKVPCEVCRKRFTSKNSLRQHLKIHNDERRYSCDFCKKRFLTFYSRQVHLRVHTRETPFTCDICQKSFRYNTSFRDHMKTHSKDKLSCDLCKKVFTRKIHWLNHIKKCSASLKSKMFNVAI